MRGKNLFPLGCGCKGANSVSISRSTTETTTDRSSLTPRRARNNPSPTETLTLPSVSNSSYWEHIDDVDQSESSSIAPSFSSLLRELNELENDVKDLGKESYIPPPPISPPVQEEERRINEGRLEKSVAVIKESDDPFGDFKKSMLQMVVENKIVSKEEMQELLQRFLVLNSPDNHDFIVRAFMEIWNEVFSDSVKTPKVATRRGGNRHYRASRKV